MKFILIDGHSFCYRAFYAIRDLRNSKGEPTNAVYGFITMLEKLLNAVEPDGVAATFDLRAPTFRHKKYEQYKIQRRPMPEELVSQMPLIKDVVRAMNIPIFEKEGYEADDVMATLARKLEKAGHEVVIVTGDKDAMQLVTRHVKILNPQKENLILDEKAVEQRFGVEPGRVVEVMALMGDASDNIPGVPGVGEKTAVKLIGQFGTLEGVLKNIPKINGDKLKENLEKYKDQARLSRELAEIDREVPLEMAPGELERREPDYPALQEIYRKLEFRTLMKGLPAASPRNADDAKLEYVLIQDKAAFEALKERLAHAKRWALDFETTSTDPLKAEPVGISFSMKPRQATYVNLIALGAKECLESLKNLFEDPKIKKVGQNLKYEINVLRGFGIRLQGVDFDTMVASYCLNTAKPNHNLEDIALEHLDIRLTPIEDLIGKGAKQTTMDKVDVDRVYRYGCQDSDVALRLSELLEKKLKEQDAEALFREIEMPLVEVLADMEYSGVAVDTKLLKEYSVEMEKQLASSTKAIHKLAGGQFNINSPKQLGEILFEKLALPVVKRTKTGPSTDVEVLTELSEVHSLPKEILKFRELSKLKSTYVDALPQLVDPRTGRVHTSFNQTVTATGRLSSSDPNLQNIPVRSEEGRKIRRAFVAGGKDRALVSADYSQIELRVLAHLSQDKHLIAAFKNDEDIHRMTASLIFNVSPAKVTDEMRDSAKTVNFGVLYGMGPFSLAKQLKITSDAAKDFIKAYFDRYPSVKAYLDATMEGARRDGYVSTAFNRRRYMPDIRSKDPRVRSFAERTAINAPIQGTASDIIKIAMARIHERLDRGGFEAKMILQVHDELLFESPKKELPELLKEVTRQMQEPVEFKVPLKVTVKTGPNWLDMEEVD